MPMLLWPNWIASRRESSRTFFARGVNGGAPLGGLPALPIVSSTFSRTASSEMSMDSSAVAAMPSPSRINPRRMCSVPMKL